MAPVNDDATRRLRELRGVTWEWREEAPAQAKQQPGMGVIAQEVEKVFPQLVSTDEQGRKQVDYSGLIAPLIEAVKELDDRLPTLEARHGQAGEQPGHESQPEAERTIHRRTPE